MFAMHAPDGFLDTPVAVVVAVVSAVVLTTALRRVSRGAGDQPVSVVALAAAFVFAAQMVDFPVAAGTSGHLIGGALLAVLLGPWLAVTAVALVVVVQALVFADGGLTALGYNVFNMAIVTAFVGWGAFRLARRMLHAGTVGVSAAAGLAAALSVVASAIIFSVQWLFGATAPVPFGEVFTSMVGVHLLIGIGEGLITATVVAVLLAVRPDLVAGARDLSPSTARARTRVGARTATASALLVIVGVAVVLSQFASASPDGLERVAIDTGFEVSATEHAFADSVFADYATRGVDNERLGLAIAGATGVGLTLVAGYGLFGAARRSRCTPTLG